MEKPKYRLMVTSYETVKIWNVKNIIPINSNKFYWCLPVIEDIYN